MENWSNGIMGRVAISCGALIWIPGLTCQGESPPWCPQMPTAPHYSRLLWPQHYLLSAKGLPSLGRGFQMTKSTAQVAKWIVVYFGVIFVMFHSQSITGLWSWKETRAAAASQHYKCCKFYILTIQSAPGRAQISLLNHAVNIDSWIVLSMWSKAIWHVERWLSWMESSSCCCCYYYYYPTFPPKGSQGSKQANR